MNFREPSGEHSNDRIELLNQTDRVVGVINSLDFELDMEVSDVNVYEEQYAFSFKAEDSSSRLEITKFELENPGEPVRTQMYAITVVAKNLDAEGLRLVEKIGITRDIVIDETRLGYGQVHAEGLPSVGFPSFTYAGDFQPQPDKITHTRTLASKYDEYGKVIYDDTPPEVSYAPDGHMILKSNWDKGTWRELEPIVSPLDILAYTEKLIAGFTDTQTN